MTRRIISDGGWVAARYIRTNEQIRGSDTTSGAADVRGDVY